MARPISCTSDRRSRRTFLPAGNGRFANNLVFFDRGLLSVFVNVGAGTAPGTFAFANNLWYAHDAPASSTPSLPAAELAAVIGLDPGFTDAAGGDYSIGAASPAAGKGERIAGVSGDFSGRCYGNPPAIGAFEAR